MSGVRRGRAGQAREDGMSERKSGEEGQGRLEGGGCCTMLLGLLQDGPE